MDRAIQAYKERYMINGRVLVYYAGREVLDTDTPRSIGLNEGDVLEIFVEDLHPNIASWD